MKQIARIAWSVRLILAVIVMCFSLVHRPGDAALVIAGESRGEPELIEQIRKISASTTHTSSTRRYLGDVLRRLRYLVPLHKTDHLAHR